MVRLRDETQERPSAAGSAPEINALAASGGGSSLTKPISGRLSLIISDS